MEIVIHSGPYRTIKKTGCGWKMKMQREKDHALPVQSVIGW